MEKEKVKKPFYKKWWFWLIVVVVIIAMIVPEDEEATKEDVEETQEETSKEDKEKETEKEKKKAAEEKKEKEDAEQKEKEANKKAEEVEEKEIKLDEEFNAMYYNARVTDAVLNDGELRLWFGWTNKSEWNPSHFTMHGEVMVTQDGEMLEEIGNTERKHKQIKLKDDDYYKMDYKLISDSDVEVSVIAFDKVDKDKEDKVITIELE